MPPIPTIPSPAEPLSLTKGERLALASSPDGVTDDRLRIIEDTDEKRPWVFDTRQVSVRRAKLREGDYTVEGLEGRVVIERKSLGDWVGTVIHDFLRFRKQLVRMSGYDLAVIVVEANIEQVYRHEYESDALPASVLGKANAILIEHGIPVFWHGDPVLAADMAHRMLLMAWRKFHDR